jgi:hypothetical protein
MKEKILAELKNKYANLGFSEKALSGVADYLSATVTEEAQIEPAATGAEQLLKAFQGDIDKRVTDAVAKAKAEAKPKTEPKEPDPDPKPKPQPEPPDWAKAIIAELSELKTAKARDQYQAALKTKLNGKVPESFLRLKNYEIKSEAEIDQLATTIEQDYSTFRQELVNQGVIIEQPRSASDTDKAGAEFAKNIALQRNKGQSLGIEGKPLV